MRSQSAIPKEVAQVTSCIGFDYVFNYFRLAAAILLVICCFAAAKSVPNKAEICERYCEDLRNLDMKVSMKGLIIASPIISNCLYGSRDNLSSVPNNESLSEPHYHLTHTINSLYESPNFLMFGVYFSCQDPSLVNCWQPWVAYLLGML